MYTYTHIYSGFIAGSMMNTTAGHRNICFIKPYDNNDSNLAMNAFAAGVLRANPDVVVRYYHCRHYYRYHYHYRYYHHYHYYYHYH